MPISWWPSLLARSRRGGRKGECAAGRAGDESKTIDVRIHGTDHATKPALATPILLWALGGLVTLVSLLGNGLWWCALRQDSG